MSLNLERGLFFILFCLWLLGCTPDKEFSIPNSRELEGLGSIVNQPMIIEGKIVELMESWPLQLSVETEMELYHVELLDDTKVIQGKRMVSPGNLSLHLHIQVRGYPSSNSPSAMLAQEIKILSDDHR